MSVDIQKPLINADTPEGQLGQIRSYLFQLAEKLNWALNLSEFDSAVKMVTPEQTAAAEQQEAQKTFNAVKNLIIKSAYVVDNLYDQMQTHLSGDYVATSDFGTYRRVTEATLLANSNGIEQLYTSTQSIENGLNGVQDDVRGIQANIKTGYLYTDDGGNDIYGLEIGQSNGSGFHKYARFTADRLSFYDQNDAEVAYISNYKLYITAAQITRSIKIGGYSLDTSSGIAFRWEG